MNEYGELLHASKRGAGTDTDCIRVTDFHVPCVSRVLSPHLCVTHYVCVGQLAPAHA